MKFWLLSLSLLTLGSLLGERAHAEQFVSLYTDSGKKLYWSKKLPGTYSNGCANAEVQFDISKCTYEIGSDGNNQVKVADSNAAKACREIGGRLPTKSELESLIKYFDHISTYDGPVLTEKGMADMQSVFGDMGKWGDDNDTLFLSSSVYPYNPRGAYALNSNVGGLEVTSRYKPNAVRCIVGR